MEITPFESKEKEFLRRQIKGVYFLRTKDSDIRFNKNYANYERLLKDMASFFNISDDIKDDATGEYFEDEEKELKAGWRSLQRFFTEDRTKIEHAVLKTLYAYATHGILTRKEVLDKINRDGFIIRISSLEREKILGALLKQLRDTIYEPYEEDEDLSTDQDPHVHLYSKIETSIRDMYKNTPSINPYLSINKEEIYTLLRNSKKQTKLEVSAFTVNTLYTIIEGQAITRREYLEKHPKLFSPFYTPFKLAGSSEFVWYENPGIPFWGMAIFILLSICLFLFGSLPESLNLYSHLTISLMVVISCLGWFIILMRQSQKNINLQDAPKSFWHFWFQNYPNNSLRVDAGVNILLVFDDNHYDSTIEVDTVLERFKIAHVFECCVSSEENVDKLQETLKKEQIHGLYFFLSDKVEQYALPKIKTWSNIHQDIPIVYVDYIGVNLEFGRIDPKSEEGVGLWSLLSQSSNRAAFWKLKTTSLQKITILFAALFIGTLITLSIAIYVQKNFVLQQYDLNKVSYGAKEKNLKEAQQLNSNQLYSTLLIEKKHLVKDGYDINEANINMNYSVFGLGDTSSNNKQLRQFADTQKKFTSNEENEQNHLALFYHPGKSIASNALTLAKNSSTIFNAVFIRKDNAGNLEGGYLKDSLSRPEMVDNIDEIFTQQPNAESENLNGIICVAQKLVLCAEFVNAEGFATEALADSNLVKTVKLMNESLQTIQQILGENTYKLFPEPNDPFYKDIFQKKMSELSAGQKLSN